MLSVFALAGKVFLLFFSLSFFLPSSYSLVRIFKIEKEGTGGQNADYNSTRNVTCQQATTTFQIKQIDDSNIFLFLLQIKNKVLSECTKLVFI